MEEEGWRRRNDKGKRESRRRIQKKKMKRRKIKEGEVRGWDEGKHLRVKRRN